MMEPIRFDPCVHLDEIAEWASARGMKPAPAYFLPDVGRIIPGVCALFLYQTDSAVGFIENLITCPKASPEAVTDGIIACVKAIEQDARDNDVALLWGSTFVPGVAARAKDLGFKVNRGKYTLISKGLV